MQQPLEVRLAALEGTQRTHDILIDILVSISEAHQDTIDSLVRTAERQQDMLERQETMLEEVRREAAQTRRLWGRLAQRYGWLDEDDPRGRGVRHPFQKERRSTHWQGDLGPHLTRPWSCPNNWLHLNHCGGNGEFESVDKEERVTGPEEIRGKQLSGTDLVRAVAKLNLMSEGPRWTFAATTLVQSYPTGHSQNRLSASAVLPTVRKDRMSP